MRKFKLNIKVETIEEKVLDVEFIEKGDKDILLTRYTNGRIEENGFRDVPSVTNLNLFERIEWHELHEKIHKIKYCNIVR